jgi:hypothetical protein
VQTAKTRFDEECSKLLHQRKQAKLQWLQNPLQTNADTVNNIRREISTIFRNTKREYMKQKKLMTLKQEEEKHQRHVLEAYMNLEMVTNLQISKR